MKYLMTILPLIVTIAVALSTPIQGWISSHPTVALIVSSVGTIIAHWMPSPSSSGK